MERSSLKRLFIYFLILLYVSDLSAKNNTTPKVVNNFIRHVEELGSLPATDIGRSNELQMKIQRCFSIDENEFDNEFFLLEIPYNDTKISARKYSIRILKYIFSERTLKVNHEIIYNEIVNNIDYGGKDEKFFYSTVIKKQMNYKGQIKYLWQNIEVPINSNFITDIYTSETEITGNDIPDKDIENLTEEQYLKLAARYYTAKKYDKAYRTYIKLTEKFEHSAEGWYRLAMLVYYGELGCKNVYSDPKKTAIEFIDKASETATDKLSKKISNVRFYWSHGNYM